MCKKMSLHVDYLRTGGWVMKSLPIDLSRTVSEKLIFKREILP